MEIKSFGGTSLNGSTGIMVRWGYGKWQPYAANTSVRQRVDMPAVIDVVTYPSKRQPFQAFIGSGYTGTVDQFMSAVNQAFSVRRGRQTKTLIVNRVAGDDATQVQIEARCIQFGRTQDNLWEGVLEIPDPVWKSSATTTDSTSPTTNAGEIEALPSIAITGGAAATRNRGTVTDRTGHGISAYPVGFDYGPGYDAANMIAYLNGRSVPFSYDTVGGKLWTRVDCRPDASSFVDIYRSTAINNTVTANALDMGGLAIDSTNAVPSWDDWQLEQHPDSASLVWLPANMPNLITTAKGLSNAWTYELHKQEAAGATFEVRLNEVVDDRNDYNAMVAVLPTPAASGATLTITYDYVNGVESESTVLSNALILTIVGRKRDEFVWTQIGSVQPNVTNSPGDTGITFSADVSDCVEIGVAIMLWFGNYSGDASSFAQIKFTDAALSSLNTSQAPAVTLSADIAARYVDGALINETTGDQITFTDLLFDDVALTLDSVGGSISPESGPWYAADIEFTNAAQWFALATGANTWTAPGSATVALTWADRSEF